jgi:hypothetical protein
VKGAVTPHRAPSPTLCLEPGGLKLDAEGPMDSQGSFPSLRSIFGGLPPLPREPAMT